MTAERIRVLAYVTSQGEVRRVDALGTCSFADAYSMAHAGDRYLIAERFTRPEGRFQLSDLWEFCLAAPNDEVRPGWYRDFDYYDAAVMAAVLMATGGK